MSQLSAEASEGGAESEEKKAKRARHLELTNELTKDMLPVLLAVYSTSAGPGVRHSCIQVGAINYMPLFLPNPPSIVKTENSIRVQGRLVKNESVDSDSMSRLATSRDSSRLESDDSIVI